MTLFEEMIVDAEEKGYFYIETDSVCQRSKAMRDDDDCAIFFNEYAFSTNAERNVALAHELGHCDTGSFYTINSPHETRGRHERRANKKAVLDRVPLDELIEACKDAWNSVWDLAERFEVTEDFMRYALDMYEWELREALADRDDVYVDC